MKNKKKGKKLPQNNPHTTAPKLVINLYIQVPNIEEKRKKMQNFFPSSHSDVSGVTSLEPERRGPQGWNVDC